jgi:diguanylate cyclase (GGDEF)-like protein
MLTETESRSLNIGMYINPVLERRAAFQQECRALFHSLQLESSTAAAEPVLARQRIDLLIIDLYHFDQRSSLIAIGGLIRSRGGAPTLVLCPYGEAAWLPALMAYGPLQYMITPAASTETQAAVRQALYQIDVAPGQDLIQFQLLAKEKELRELLVIQRNLQRALAETDHADRVAEQVCKALCMFPGVRHASLFHLKQGGNLQLAAQESRNHLDLVRLLDGSEYLQQSPLAGVFPGLMAAITGELVLLDAPEKTGNPELAVSLEDREAQVVFAVPLMRNADGQVQGSICLMFDRTVQLSREQFTCFSSLAQLVSYGLSMSELKLRNEQLLRQFSQSAANDAASGATSRLEGEQFLTREIGRARRYALPLALITFDVGNVPALSHTGSPAADSGSALRTVVAAAQARLRGADALVSLGDSEFLIIAPHTVGADALKVAEKIRELVAGSSLPDGGRLSISVGVAELEPEEDSEQVMRRLDAALRRARTAGLNCVEMATH